MLIIAYPEATKEILFFLIFFFHFTYLHFQIGGESDIWFCLKWIE